jgi:uncharacterized protein YuzE
VHTWRDAQRFTPRPDDTRLGQCSGMTPERRYAWDVRIVYYEEDDAAYIELREIEKGGVARTEYMPPDYIELDFDHEGRLVGIGFDGAASKRLPRELLAEAERPPPTPKADRIHGEVKLDPATMERLQRVRERNAVYEGVSTWFAGRGLDLFVAKDDGVWWASLWSGSESVVSRYARGDSPEMAALRARERYEQEQ